MARQSGEDLHMSIGLTTRLACYRRLLRVPARGSALWAVLVSSLLLSVLIPGIGVAPLAPNTVLAAGSHAAATSAPTASPTTLPLRSGSSIAIFGGTSARTIQSAYGSSVTTEPFTATTNYDFYSAP